MGVFYHIQPLDEEMASLLEEMGAAVPNTDEPSRNPTLAEVREVCTTVGHYKTAFSVKPKSHWQAVIESTQRDEGTILNAHEFKDSEDEPHRIWFEKGSPALILEIVKRLAKHCGPLVILPDSGEPPIAVTAKASVKKLLDEWEHTQGDSL
jgi:hypothetical protein